MSMMIMFSMLIMSFFMKNLYFLIFLFSYMLFLFFMNINWYYMNSIFMSDYLSMLLIILTLWIIYLMIMTSFSFVNYKINSYMFTILVLMLMFFLLFCFFSVNVFIFYFFFEMSLLPIFLLIMGWGFNPERLQASMYMMFYTMLLSMPFLLLIFYYNMKLGSFNMFSMKLYKILFFNNVMYIMMCLVFLVKLPIFFLHMWLPKAHVEAPLVGSMILAGILLKLGGYGLARFFFLMEKSHFFNNILLSISFIGSVIVTFIVYRQVDLKSLVAYSSVSHMGMAMIGIFTFFKIGWMGMILMMLCHGLTSSSLFSILNISYEKNKSRSIMINKNFQIMNPTFSLWMFMLIMMNMASPPSLTFFSELFLISSLFMYNFIYLSFLIILLFMSGVYSIYLFITMTQSGLKFNVNFYNYMIRDSLMIFFHIFPLILLYTKLEIFII